jgi:hypothetical protein
MKLTHEKNNVSVPYELTGKITQEEIIRVIMKMIFEACKI